MIFLSQEKILQDKSITFNEKFYNFTDKEIKKKISNKKISIFVKKRFSGKTDRDSKYAFKKKNKKNSFQLKNFFSENKKKTILFCPHLFSDSLSATGKFPFRDFFDFYYKSVKSH